MLPYTSLKNVFKESTLGVNTALSIHVQKSSSLGFNRSNEDNNDNIYIFRSFISRDDAYAILRVKMDEARAALEKINNSKKLYGLNTNVPSASDATRSINNVFSSIKSSINTTGKSNGKK
jgi:hypothetical protein